MLSTEILFQDFLNFYGIKSFSNTYPTCTSSLCINPPSNIQSPIHALQAQMLSIPWNSTGQNIGVGSLPLFRGSSQPRVKDAKGQNSCGNKRDATKDLDLGYLEIESTGGIS